MKPVDACTNSRAALWCLIAFTLSRKVRQMYVSGFAYLIFVSASFNKQIKKPEHPAGNFKRMMTRLRALFVDLLFIFLG